MMIVMIIANNLPIAITSFLRLKLKPPVVSKRQKNYIMKKSFVNKNFSIDKVVRNDIIEIPKAS
ncbi:MAG: hypothetical protein IJ728_09380 [Selenomonadaceae bacterium]|nr:hypothetical protein [Selenomonadaceae bacterium]